MTVSNSSRSVVCQRCGRGFVATISYLEYLTRRGVKVRIPVLCMTCFLKAGPLPKQQGEVKWFNPHKGYGFIATQEGPNVFLHQTQILEGTSRDGPTEGQPVQFHVHYSQKGPEAWNVELA